MILTWQFLFVESLNFLFIFIVNQSFDGATGQLCFLGLSCLFTLLFITSLPVKRPIQEEKTTPSLVKPVI